MTHTLALDYDDTYTAAKDFWGMVAKTALLNGFQVYVVTIRNADLDTIPDEKYFNDLGVMIVYCDGKPKKEVCDSLGIKVSWWVDDKPETIHLGSQTSPDDLAKWRRANLKVIG